MSLPSRTDGNKTETSLATYALVRLASGPVNDCNVKNHMVAITWWYRVVYCGKEVKVLKIECAGIVGLEDKDVGGVESLSGCCEKIVFLVETSIVRMNVG